LGESIDPQHMKRNSSKEGTGAPRLHVNSSVVTHRRGEFWIKLLPQSPERKEETSEGYMSPKNANVLTQELEMMTEEYEVTHGKIPEPQLGAWESRPKKRKK